MFSKQTFTGEHCSLVRECKYFARECNFFLPSKWQVSQGNVLVLQENANVLRVIPKILGERNNFVRECKCFASKL